MLQDAHEDITNIDCKVAINHRARGEHNGPSENSDARARERGYLFAYCSTANIILMLLPRRYMYWIIVISLDSRHHNIYNTIRAIHDEAQKNWQVLHLRAREISRALGEKAIIYISELYHLMREL